MRLSAFQAFFGRKIQIGTEQDSSICLYFNHMAFPKQAFRLKKSWPVLIAHETLDVIDDVGMLWFCALVLCFVSNADVSKKNPKKTTHLWRAMDRDRWAMGRE